MKRAYLVLLVAAMFSQGSLMNCGGSDETGGEICNNLVDDDADGAIDCLDADCAGNAACANVETLCADGQDNDGDGLIDCQDLDCSLDAACANRETNCADGVDNDSDGAFDCLDSDCAGDAVCQVPTTETNCSDGKDDDQDALIDCDDPDCAEDASCLGALSCQTMIICSQCCDSSDVECQNICAESASTDAINEMTAINACLQTSCPTECAIDGGSQEACSACTDLNCATEMDACDGGSVPKDQGSGCYTLIMCMQGCPGLASSGTSVTCPNDPGMLCYNDCFQSADVEAWDLLWGFNDCIIEECNDECIEADCDTECAVPSSTACSTCMQPCTDCQTTGPCAGSVGACLSDG